MVVILEEMAMIMVVGGDDSDDDGDGQKRAMEKKTLFMFGIKAKLELTTSPPCSLGM